MTQMTPLSPDNVQPASEPYELASPRNQPIVGLGEIPAYQLREAISFESLFAGIEDAYKEDESTRMDAAATSRQRFIAVLVDRQLEEPRAERHFSFTISDRRGQPSGPIKFFLLLLKTWKLERGDAVALLGFERAELGHVDRLLEGHALLTGRDVKDRIAYLFEVRRTLAGLFRNEDVENAWLREPHAGLGERSPLDMLLEGTMENLLVIRDYVLNAAGK